MSDLFLVHPYEIGHHRANWKSLAMKPSQALCPLCNLEARFEPHNFGRTRHYACQSCGEFVISNVAERRLANSAENWRAALRAHVKATPEGKIAVIRRPKVTTQPGSTNLALEAVYVEKADLQQ